MNMDALVQFELERHDWLCQLDACGPCDHVPEAIRRILRAKSPSEVDEAYWGIENHVVVQGQIFEAAEPTARVLIAALSVTDRPDFIKIAIIELLFQIASGAVHSEAVARGHGNILDRCRSAIREGLLLLYAEVAMNTKASEGAAELLRIVDRDTDRVESILGRETK